MPRGTWMPATSVGRPAPAAPRASPRAAPRPRRRRTRRRRRSRGRGRRRPARGRGRSPRRPWSAAPSGPKATETRGPRERCVSASCRDGHAGHEHGDAARRDEHAQVVAPEVLRQQARLRQQALGEPRLVAVPAQLAQDRLAEAVRQLLAADLDEQGRARSCRRRPRARLGRRRRRVFGSACTSRYRRATLRARSRTRAMCAVRSVTLITPRASSRLKVWLHLSTWS